MEAGRELDALIAEKIIGWRVDYDSYRHWTDIPGVKAKDLILSEPGYIFHGEKTIEDVPHYSTDIAAAWQVAEKVRLTVAPFGADMWSATHDGKYFRVEHSAPYAICLAALRACGVEVV